MTKRTKLSSTRNESSHGRWISVGDDDATLSRGSFRREKYSTEYFLRKNLKIILKEVVIKIQAQ